MVNILATDGAPPRTPVRILNRGGSAMLTIPDPETAAPASLSFVRPSGHTFLATYESARRGALKRIWAAVVRYATSEPGDLVRFIRYMQVLTDSLDRRGSVGSPE
jgi:hypothetical protein